MFAGKIRSMLGVHWLILFSVVLAAWTALYLMAIPADLRETSRVFGSAFWNALCTVTPDLAGFGRVTLMWALMSAAMMLPTALPAFAAYDDIQNTETEPLHLVAGFIAIWFGFSVFAAALQMALFNADLVSNFGDSRSFVLSALLLGIAAAYQFSPLKAACLKACRSPVSFFMQHWDDGPWRMGLRLGATCVGCCWALMLLAFVGGVMSLAFMGLATLIMTLEKLPDLGRWIDRPLGVALAAGSVWTLATAL